MKNLKSIFLSLLAATAFVACSDDDIVIDDPIPSISEAQLLLESIRRDGGVPFDVDNPATVYPAAANVFIPSVLGVDYRVDRNVVEAGPTARFPMFQGWETTPNGPREGYYIITEASDEAFARELGIIFAPRMADAIGSGGEQNATFTDDGRLIFEGSVDFSFSRSLVNSGASEDGLLFGFPPAEVNPGAIADENWSSYVVLPSGIVINAQMMANETGIHDRIPNPDGFQPQDEDDLGNPNLSIATASVVMQLLDGWQDGKPFYFHIVTDTSDPGASAIEYGVLAPRLANLPTFGLFPGGSLLPFSPTVNGRTGDNGDGLGFQGLNTAALSDRQRNDPTNTFPIQPTDERYSPMWDAHLTESTIPNNIDRPILTSFDQINQALEDGTLIPFRGNANPSPLANDLSDLLTSAGAIINCPVISQPDASVIGQQFGDPTN